MRLGIHDRGEPPRLSVVAALLLLGGLLLVAGPAVAAPAADERAPGQVFADLRNHWAEAVVLDLHRQGVVQGYPGGYFRPDERVTRLQALLFFARALELEPAGEALPFTDAALVPPWSFPEIRAAAALVRGTTGDGGRLFLRPFDPLTRAQLAVLLHRALIGQSLPIPPAAGDPLRRFRDALEVPRWARDAVSNVAAAGLLQGNDQGLMEPGRAATRAELAVVIARLKDPSGFDGAGGGAAGQGVDAGSRRTAGYPRAVIGFYARSHAGDIRALRSLRENADVLALVAQVGFALDGAGQLQGRSDPQLLEEAGAKGLPVAAVVSNDLGSGFDRRTAASLLGSRQAAERAASAVTEMVQREGYQAVVLDFENLSPAQRGAYNRFVATMAAALDDVGSDLYVTVPAKTEDLPAHSWSGAFDYVTLGRLADGIIPMGYDEHWFGGEPGPVASLLWVRAIADYSGQAIPADRIFLGVPAYGYDWPSSGHARAFPGREGPVLAARWGAEILWDDQAQVPYFTYRDPQGEQHQVYFENAHSLRAKLRVVESLDLAGVALWRMGYEDPEIWTHLRRYRRGEAP